MYFVYILKCVDSTFYTGIAKDIEARLETHKEGKGSKYVRARLPFTLIYKETIPTRSQALKRELQIKSMNKVEKNMLIHKK